MASFTNGKESDNGEQLASHLTSPTALRKLVLNYLVHHCYTDTAQAFAHDGISTSSSRGGAEASTSALAMNATTPSASGSKSSSRTTNVQNLGSAHPLSAPPLSREDSSMEIEVDSLLSLAGGRGLNGNGQSAASNGHGNGALDGTIVEGEEDTQMGDSSQARDTTSHMDTLGSEELSAEELQSVRIRSGECR